MLHSRSFAYPYLRLTFLSSFFQPFTIPEFIGGNSFLYVFCAPPFIKGFLCSRFRKPLPIWIEFLLCQNTFLDLFIERGSFCVIHTKVNRNDDNTNGDYWP